jgi:hypothetical protein
MWSFFFSRLNTSVAALNETHQHNKQKQHARRNMQQVSLSSRPLVVVAGNNTEQISRKLWQEECIKTGTAAIYQTKVTSHHYLSDACGMHVRHTCQHLELRN